VLKEVGRSERDALKRGKWFNGSMVGKEGVQEERVRGSGKDSA
jgi:hypothetical protein